MYYLDMYIYMYIHVCTHLVHGLAPSLPGIVICGITICGIVSPGLKPVIHMQSQTEQLRHGMLRLRFVLIVLRNINKTKSRPTQFAKSSHIKVQMPTLDTIKIK